MSEPKPKASGRGGFRPGSGRPEVGGRVTVYLGDLLARVDAAAADAHCSRGAMVRTLLGAALGCPSPEARIANRTDQPGTTTEGEPA